MARARRTVLVAQVKAARPASGVSAAKKPAPPRWDNNGKWPVAGTGKLAGKTTYYTPPAAAPAQAAPPPPPAAQPWDSRSQFESANAWRKYGDTIAGLQSERDIRQRQIGLAPGYENNPYSEAAMLQRGHEIGRRGTLTTAGLHLYAGSTANRLGQVDFHFNEGMTGLKEREAAEEAKWQREEEAALHNRESAEEEAALGAAERAAESEPAPVAAAAQPGGGSGPQPGSYTGTGGYIKPFKAPAKKSGGGGGGGGKGGGGGSGSGGTTAPKSGGGKKGGKK